MRSGARTASRTGPGWIQGVILLLLTSLLTPGCAGPGYYWQAATGHLHLMNQRQDIDTLLHDPDTDPLLTMRLQTAREILAFAEAELELPTRGSYQSFLQVGGPVAWNVVATDEFSLEPKYWCFAVAGCVMYRGYFEQAKAQRFGEKLTGRGMDVAVSPAAAYSTLGWFEDPILDTMLEQAPARLAGTLFHELAHQRLYVRGDSAFNEAYASFIEEAGVTRWLQGQEDGGKALRQWREMRMASNQFAGLLRDFRRELEALYESGTTEPVMRKSKQEILKRLRLHYRDLVDRQWEGRDYFGDWLRAGLNNAHLATISAYTDGRCAFGELLRQAEGDLGRFNELAAMISRLEMTERKTWLGQECAVVASQPEL